VNSISPVWTEKEVELELVCALEQKQYFPIILLPVNYGDGTSGASVRFQLSEEEKRAILEGADIVITELTFGEAFTPIHIAVTKPNTRPEGHEE
jgi:hypothetical protein